MDEMPFRVAVSAVIRKGDYYLFGKKAEGAGPYPDKWLIIGGGIRLGKETIEEALRREIREEANIEVKNLAHLGFEEDFRKKKGILTHFIFLNFMAEYGSGEERPGDDIVELRWVHKDEIKELDVCEPSLKLFSDLGLR
ncbi:MAG: NUDIX domain-containing protein [Candidatus Woesearchaeota archaeon]|nr:NUDIX domain-containing protein [Candidatus Woesearchaeota archaeon]